MIMNEIPLALFLLCALYGKLWMKTNIIYETYETGRKTHDKLSVRHEGGLLSQLEVDLSALFKWGPRDSE